MKTNTQTYYIAQSPENFTQDLVQAADSAISWGNAIGIGVLASLLAIGLIHYLFWRN